MASITRSDRLGSLSLNISSHSGETISKEKPYLSFNHPQGPGSPPSDNFVHISSISCCVVHFTINEIASVNLNRGPPFNATNSWPSISNVTVMIEPLGRPET